jgi:hypothetical protein
MAVTQRDFVAVADVIHASNATAAGADERAVSISIQESNLSLAANLAAYFKAANPRFDLRRFMRACGYAQKVEDC